MAVDVVIKNGVIVNFDSVITAWLAIKNGKVVQIGESNQSPEAAKVIDANGNFVIPGLVDAHVHLGFPSPAMLGSSTPLDEHLQKESKASAAGGITTFIPLIFTPDDLLEAANSFIEAFEKNGFIDVSLSANIVSKEQIKQIQQLTDSGIIAFKLLTPYRGDETIAGIPGIDDGIIYLTFEEIGRLAKQGYKAFCRVHCENVEIFFKIRDRYKGQGIEPALWTETRPNICEAEAMQSVIYLASSLGCPLYIVHVSIGEGVDILAKAKAAGVNVVGETCPHYLVLNAAKADRVLSKVNPPLRYAEDNERLWEGIRNGDISVVATDHAPIRKQLKQDIWSAFPGFCGLETLLPIMLSEGVNQNRISLEKLVEVCCYNPAKIYGLSPQKGVIRVGSDADLVIIDLNKEIQVGESPVYSDADFTVYGGWRMRGAPVLTMLRGNVVMEEGKITAQPGIGRYIPAKAR